LSDVWGRTCTVHALVELEAGSTWDLLRELGPDFETQWRYFWRPKDAFSGRVVTVWRVDEPQLVALRSRHEGRQHAHGMDHEFLSEGFSGLAFKVGMHCFGWRSIECFRSNMIFDAGPPFELRVGRHVQTRPALGAVDATIGGSFCRIAKTGRLTNLFCFSGFARLRWVQNKRV
jgi:hypothetical protein